MNRELLRMLRDEIDEANYHPRGNTWNHVNELLDCPGQVVGSLGAWTLALGGVPTQPEPLEPLGVDYETLCIKHDLDELARMTLELSPSQYECLRGSSAATTKAAISALLHQSCDWPFRACDCESCRQMEAIRTPDDERDAAWDRAWREGDRPDALLVAFFIVAFGGLGWLFVRLAHDWMVGQ